MPRKYPWKYEIITEDGRTVTDTIKIESQGRLKFYLQDIYPNCEIVSLKPVSGGIGFGGVFN